MIVVHDKNRVKRGKKKLKQWCAYTAYGSAKDVYRGGLNTGRVWFSYGCKLSDHQMVQFLNAI